MEHKQRREKGGLLDTLLDLRKGSHADAAMHGLFTTLSNLMDDALIITDHQFTILHTNHSVHRSFAYQAAELIAQHLSILFSDRQWVPFADACLAYASQPAHPSTPFKQTVTVTNKHHLEVPLAVSVQCLRVGQESVLLFLFGAAEPRASGPPPAPQKRSQQLRLQAIGRLTAGLAHEYNNLLTSIVGYSEILKARLTQDEALSRYIEHISHASNRAADLTHHVMAFSRHRSDQPEMCELNAVISDMEKMIRGLFREDVDLAFQLTPNLGLVWIDLGALLQILIIVILAVREGLTPGSQVLIATRKHRPRPEGAASPGEERGAEFINLAVSAKIETSSVAVDEPAATQLELEALREDLEGVSNLIRQVGGEIEVVNVPATEKLYNLYFPLAHHPPVSRATENVLPASHADIGTILVVDDEEMIRTIIREALQAEGYQVLEASGPTEALDLSHQYEHAIHLLVTDVVMPGMNGRELADRLVAERPYLRMLFISGHSPSRLSHSGVGNLQGRFLQKPFLTSTLVEKVRSALAHPSPQPFSSESSG